MMAQLEAPQAKPIEGETASTNLPVELVPDPLREHAHLADIPLRMEALLDRVTMNMRAVASLQKGSVLTLTRSAGDNVDLWVGGVKLASGEIVVIEDTLGVRITDLLTGE
jgi:flagellar motor switch protein FliN/FliY